MYIQCKKEFKTGRFQFEEGDKCPVSNISGRTYYFDYPNGQSDFISTSYLEELKDYLEFKDEALCDHPAENYEEIWGELFICPVCQELIKVLDSKHGDERI